VLLKTFSITCYGFSVTTPTKSFDTVFSVSLQTKVSKGLHQAGLHVSESQCCTASPLKLLQYRSIFIFSIQ